MSAKGKKLVRQSTCPAVIAREAIPFCIPSYNNSRSNTSTDTNDLRQDARFSHRRQITSSSLGSLNKDLYIVDQYENREDGDAHNGFFSSSSPACFPPGNVGRVWFRVTYEAESETLILSLLKARNLRRKSSTKEMAEINEIEESFEEESQHKRSSSLRIKRKLFAMSKRYTVGARKDSSAERGKIINNSISSTPRKINSLVNIYLLPDMRIFGQAKCKKVDIDPVFVDRFVYQITSSELKSRSIRMVFVEIDEAKRHHIIGHVTKPLCLLKMDGTLSFEDLVPGQPPRSKDSMDGIDSEILISLCYDDDLSKLTIVLLRMKLHASTESVNAFEQDIQLRLNIRGKCWKEKKWKHIRREAAIENETVTEFGMNESFRVDLKSQDFNVANITITMKSCLQKKATTSSVVLGGYMFARREALEHWYEMTSNPNQFVQRWHNLTSSVVDGT